VNRFSIIEEHPIKGKRLGRHVEHDERSWGYRFGIIDPASLKTVHHRHYGGVLNQGQLGSCTGNAAAQCVNTVPLHTAGEVCLKEAQAVEIYELGTRLDSVPGEYPPDDTGSSGLAVAKACVKLGHITSYKHAMGIEEALTALQKQPVITGVVWYEGFDTPDDTGLVKIAGQIRGGHEFVVVGYEHHETINDSIVDCINSWGSAWGVNGRFRFTVRTWKKLLAMSGDVTIL